MSAFNLRFLSFDVKGAWSPFHASGLLAAGIIVATDALRARMASSIALIESPPVLAHGTRALRNLQEWYNETYSGIATSSSWRSSPASASLSSLTQQQQHGSWDTSSSFGVFVTHLFLGAVKDVNMPPDGMR